ncbi:type I toxin-antitoxin system Fst family toxin [Lactobacillus hominis]|nr:type I toxin-antitoxin system Fst family toxin [Lactobacillus hominis]
MDILLAAIKDTLTLIIAPIIVQINIELFKHWLQKNDKNSNS